MLFAGTEYFIIISYTVALLKKGFWCKHCITLLLTEVTTYNDPLLTSLLLWWCLIWLPLKASRSYPGFLARPPVTKAARKKMLCLRQWRCFEERGTVSLDFFHLNMNSGTGMALVKALCFCVWYLNMESSEHPKDVYTSGRLMRCECYSLLHLG